jgi:hypothetical protein
MRKCFIFVLLTLFFLPTGVFAQSSSNQTPDTVPGTAASIEQSSDNQTPGSSNNRPGVPQMNREDRKVYQAVQGLREKVQQAIKAKDLKKAEGLFAKMNAMLDNNQMSSYYRNRLVASIHRNEQKAIYEKQAQYQKAANAIRIAVKYDKKDNDLKKLLKTQEKVGMQRELFNLRKSHQKDLYKLEKSRQDYLNMKLSVLKQTDKGQGLSDNALKYLQRRLKNINSKLQTVNQNIKATQTRYRRNFEKLWGQGVYLTQEQREVVLKDAAPHIRIKNENQRILKAVTKHLTNIAQNSEITWKDLLKNFSELSELQRQIISLRRDLEGMARGPWSRDRYDAAKKLRVALERAMEKAAELMKAVEQAFIDTKAFAKLSPKEKIEFLKLFKDVWGKEKEIQSMKPSLEDIYKKIFEGPIDVGPMPGEPVPFDPPLPVEPQPEPDRPQPEPVEPQLGENDEISGYGYIYQRENYWYLKCEGGPYLTMNLPTNYMINELEVKFSGKLYEPLTNSADATVQRMQQIMFTSIYAPQLPDEPYQTPGASNEPSEVIEEQIDNQDKPANLLNAF